MQSNFGIGNIWKEPQVYLAGGLLSIAVATLSLPAHLGGLYNEDIGKITPQIAAILQVK